MCPCVSCGETKAVNGFTLCPTCATKGIDRRTFNDDIVRSSNKDKGRFDLLPNTALELLAKHFQKGAELYGDNNWRKGAGMPISVLLDSGFRHLNKALRGDPDEDHLVAAAWNIMCALELRETKK